MTQEGFWFIDQLHPETAVHNLAFGADLVGPLDTAALSAALGDLTARHSLLRCRFAVADGTLRLDLAGTERDARSGDPADIPLQFVDVPTADAAGFDAPTADWARRPFDYTGGPMVRTVLLRGGPERHRLVLVAHHAVFDGWSFHVFLDELAALYRQHAAGVPARLPELDLDYADFALWQREALAAGAFAADLGFWADELADPPPPLELRTDFARPARTAFRGGAHRFTLSAADVAAVRASAAEESATEFMAHLVALQVLLHRHSGRTDVAVAAPVANRPDPRLERVVGPFINVLVLRGDLSGDPTLRELLIRARRRCTSAFAHQDLPLQTAIDQAAKARGGAAAAPFLRASLALLNVPAGRLDLGPGLSVRPFPVDTGTAQNDLALYITPGPDGAEVLLQYDSDLFRPERAAELGAEFAGILRTLARNPDLSLSRLSRTVGRPSRTPEARSSRSAPFPLDVVQRRWWAAEQARPGDPANRLGATYEPEGGALDHGRLQDALYGLERRHEVLRCAFSADGRTQTVVPPGRLLLGGTAGAPWLDAEVVDAGAGRPAVRLRVHRALADERLFGLLLRDLVALYTDRDAPTAPAGLPGPGLVDRALARQRSGAGRGGEEYWRTRAPTPPEPLGLPSPGDRPAAPSGPAATEPIRVPAETAGALDAVCRATGAPLAAGLAAALAVLLRRHTDRTDTVIGLDDERPPEGDPARGPLAAALPLRIEVPAGATFRELLAAVHTEIDAAARVPVPATHPEPVCRARLSLRDPGLADGDPPGVTRIDRVTAEDLVVELTARDGALTGAMRYRADLFEPSLARGLAERWPALLARLCAAPDRPVADIPVLTSAEQTKLLADWDATGDAAPDTTPLALFARQAAAAPDAPAVVAEGRTVSYRELDAWSDRIANGLAHLGAGGGRPVALVLDTGAEAVAALFGVLKAGASMVCLDPRQPADRLDALIAGLSPDAVVVDSTAGHGTTGAPRAVPGIPFVSAADLAGHPDSPPRRASDVRPADPAYLAYTSGSTGRPKGIPHTHRDLAQFTAWQSAQFGIGPGSRVAQSAALAFDVALCEIFGALCHGAALCVRPPGPRADPVGLASWLAAERITLLQVIPRLLDEILTALPGPLPALRTVMFVGEALPSALAGRARDRLGPDVRLVNVYGPTEVVAATFHQLGAGPARGAVVPVGRPIAGRQVLVLDEAGRLCPPGVRGEICVLSPYLTPGYPGEEAETARRFRPGPFTEGGARGTLYRTGDLGRLTADGTLLEFAGRADNQVKISGVRLELEAVEAAVARHPDVEECAVAMVTTDHGQRLVGYVVTARGGPPDAIRDFLRDTVPAYMVPAELIALPRLPRTLTGKVDRAALPAPTKRSAAAGPARRAPRTFAERRIAELVGEVLDVTDVGPDDDFFALGGNSLQAARLVNRIRETLGVELPLQTLLDAPTVAAAAEAAGARGDFDGRLAAIERELEQLPAEHINALLVQHRAGPATDETEL
ncbi:amino acid adenylation domain-containing protein [Streptomyces sp. NPDC014894]|uniref:amino acid adenylation domain-containing protein n=1 Tax=Streptomyces sp. NPDC014894 TaxID=3364931 RepID=UPI0036F8F912